MQNAYTYTDKVKGFFLFSSILMFLFVVTIPVGIYLLLKSRSASLVFDEGGFTASGLGLTSRWNYEELARIGTLKVEVQGGGPLVALNGGAVAVNLVGKTKAGKTMKFMLSRFEDWSNCLDRIQQESGLELEHVRQGAMGPAWPKE